MKLERWLARGAYAVLILLGVVAAVAPLWQQSARLIVERRSFALTPASPAAGSVAELARSTGASALAPLGAEPSLHELLSWWVAATHNVVVVSASVCLLSLVFGAALGLLVLYAARGLGVLLARLVELGGAVPSLILIGVLRVWDPTGGVLAVISVLSLLRGLEIAQLVRTHVLRIAVAPHVEAARALGASRRRLLWMHVVPALAGPLAVHLAFGTSAVIGLEAALSFTGLGLPASMPSWGAALGQLQHSGAWLPIACAALSIALASSALYVVGARLAAQHSSS